MQFNSFIFILAFLPFFLIAYYVGNKLSVKSGRWIIVFAGLVFYYHAGLESFITILLSSIINYFFVLMLKSVHKASRAILSLSISFNAILLLFYKYVSYVVTTTNVDSLTSDVTTNAFPQNIVIPLGISFFTFQQIMYDVSVYKGEIEKVDILDYAAYIMFFPKMIMGPLVEPKDILSQINNSEKRKINFNNIASGLKLFSFGLLKKQIFADTFARGVKWGFGWGYSNIDVITSTDMILTMLFYTFEIYFDFSGYTDMAMGISKMINIELPINFDSPYKAVSIRDFWKRWHVSLTHFFTKYLYYPLGGNRKGKIRTYINVMIVFLVSGLWHGANYTFILWGGIYGLLQVLERIFDKYLIRLSEVVRWFYTFSVVNILWLLFRSESIEQWYNILCKIVKFQSTEISVGLMESFILPETPLLFRVLHLTRVDGSVRGFSMILFIVISFIICLVPNNNYKTKERRSIMDMALAAAAFMWGFLCLCNESVFVYFNF
ncbi:MAG: MBOAT family protein [Lachnospiraceae bacterium]|nr:MBOAT family protein [Lachnospiraceae bacterium]